MEQKINESHTETFDFTRINNIIIKKDGQPMTSIVTGGSAAMKITIDYIKNNITLEL